MTERTVDSGPLGLCHKCQKWKPKCFRAIDDVPYYSTLCPECLVKCPQGVAEHYEQSAPEAAS